jgi:two-component system response regulator
MTEPFEYFEFIQKPFEQKELIEAIKAAMVKARKPRRTAMTTAGGASTVAATGDISAAEFQQLQAQVQQLQSEVAQLKGQLGKVLAFIKQKLK